PATATAAAVTRPIPARGVSSMPLILLGLGPRLLTRAVDPPPPYGGHDGAGTAPVARRARASLSVRMSPEGGEGGDSLRGSLRGGRRSARSRPAWRPLARPRPLPGRGRGGPPGRGRPLW